MKPTIENPPRRVPLRNQEKSPKPDDYENCTTPVFDFDSHWVLIKPHLENPKLQATLKKSLEQHLAWRASLCSHVGLNPEPWQIQCDPKLGPWQYGGILGITGRIEQFPQKRGFCVCCEEEADLYSPESGSREWYQTHGAGPWLTAWQKELGEMVFPKLSWKSATDGYFGIAYGKDEGGEIKVVFDLMDSPMPEEEMLFFLRMFDGQ